jgi:uncharacterized Fe-S cluster protein YjdI
VKDLTKTYSTDEIIVKWQPSLCIHSKKCWQGLPSVFKPREQPWITLDGSGTEQTIKQIDQCPSGALSYQLKKNIIDASLITNHIEISANGPILVHGKIELTHSNGKKETKEKVTALCRCGASGNKPFCDGSHNTISFKD